MGSFAAATTEIHKNDSSSAISVKEACVSLQPNTVHIILKDIQYELRRMALCMSRVPYQGHQAAHIVRNETREQQLQLPMTMTDDSPFFPDAQLDDAVIHFRCGDILGKRAHRRYRYVRWSALAKQISPEVRSIGIVTQPTASGQSRQMDRSHIKEGRCSQ